MLHILKINNFFLCQVQILENEKKKNSDKIKHLETQLSVALSQLSHKTVQSKDSADRYKSSRTHINQQRLNSAKLSINQQAQLRRSQRGGASSGTNSTSGSKYTLMSLPSTPNSTMGTLKSDGDSHSPESSEGMPGSPGASNAFLNDGDDRTKTDSSSLSQRTVSSACLVM